MLRNERTTPTKSVKDRAGFTPRYNEDTGSKGEEQALGTSTVKHLTKAFSIRVLHGSQWESNGSISSR